jgi:hypothetical protein
VSRGVGGNFHAMLIPGHVPEHPSQPCAGRADRNAAVVRKTPTARKATFRREWNSAFALVAAAAVVLLAAGHTLAGVLAAMLGVGAVAARWAATRCKGRGFYD